jgi:hypothetical protein
MSERSCRLAIALTLAGVLAGTTAAVAQVTVIQDPNHRYLDINGVARPLIGLSSEYLPHIIRPNHVSDYCTYDNYKTCIDSLVANGLNKMQVWVMMENSVGLSDLNPGVHDTGCPASTSLNTTNWTNDQPFFWRPGNRWNLDRINPTFFTQLNNVLSYAAMPAPQPGIPNPPPVIVEVTLFDAYNGAYCTSPWHAGMNVGTSDGSIDIQFSDRKYFTAFDNDILNSVDCGLSDNSPNQKARQRQMTALQWAVQQLNGNTNFYWNIANEPDESPIATTTTSTTALLNWHNCVASKIAQFESSLPNKHLIGVNFWTNTALNALATSGNANIKIASGHYSTILCTNTNADNCPVVHSAKTFFGAIPELNGFWSTLPNDAFGFSETKSSPDPSLATARAEAWEFMIGEGAMYDNYNLNRSDPRTTKVLGYLNYLRQFLAPFTLTHFGRQAGTTKPLWVVSGLPNYPPATQYSGGDGAGLGNTYWSAMQWSWNQDALYLHHSLVPLSANPLQEVEFKSYAPCYKATGYQNTFTFALGGSPGWYYAEWFAPDVAAPGSSIAPLCTNNINWSSGTTAPMTSPLYPYDLAVRILRCPGGVGPCAIEKSCAGLPVPPLPPEDTRRLPACSMGSANP